MSKITYTTDVAHCMGIDCPIRDNCYRYHLHDYYRDNYVNVGFRFRFEIPYTMEQYDLETEECEMFKELQAKSFP
jgi:hypothetical protein